MDLESYLQKKKLQKKEFAKLIRVSNACISHIVNKKREPSLEIARRIIKETKGKVNVSDLFNPESKVRFIINEIINESV